MSKEQALQALGSVHAYALNALGPNHTMTRDMAIWLQRHFGAQGTATIQANSRAKAAASKEPSNAGPSTLKKFVHPKSEAHGVAASAGEPPKKLQVAEKRPGRLEPPAEPVGVRQEAPATVNKNPVAAEPLDEHDLKDLKGLKPRVIANRYKSARIAATLRECFDVSDDEMPKSEMQMAAMLKAKANA